MKLLKKPALVLAAGLSAIALAACSGDGGSSYTPPPATGGGGTPPPTTPPVSGPISPNAAASRFGGGFVSIFVSGPFTAPVDASTVNLPGVDPTGTPIDITNP